MYNRFDFTAISKAVDYVDCKTQIYRSDIILFVLL